MRHRDHRLLALEELGEGRGPTHRPPERSDDRGRLPRWTTGSTRDAVRDAGDGRVRGAGRPPRDGGRRYALRRRLPPAGRGAPSRPADQPSVRQDRGGEQLRLRPPVLLRAPRLHRRHAGLPRPLSLRGDVLPVPTRGGRPHRHDRVVRTATGRRRAGGDVRLLVPGLQPAPRGADTSGRPEGDRARRSRPAAPTPNGSTARAPSRSHSRRHGRTTSRSTWRRGVATTTPSARYAGALGNAPGLFWVLPLTAHPAAHDERHPVLPRLARPPDLRRLLAALRGRPCRDRRSRSPRRRLVGRVRTRHGAQLPGARRARTRPAEARHRAVASHALGAARRRRGRRRLLGRRRLAAPLLGSRPQGRGDRRLRQRRDGVRHERRLARSRRLATVIRPSDRLVPPLRRPRADALRRRVAVH